jgi:hypothetical protein
MKFKIVLQCALVVFCSQASLTWGGPILSTVSITPSELKGPGGNPGKNYMYTNTACVNAYGGQFVSCTYDFTITELTQPNSDPANNGGHSHTYSDHPLGKLEVVSPNPGAQSTVLQGSTQNTNVQFKHEIPNVSGKISTVLNLKVPPGWYTVYPEDCDGTFTYWCFNTTVDVGVTGLSSLPDSPSLYNKVRNPDAGHTDAVAFYGTSSAQSNLGNIAAWYNFLTFGSVLSINDMSLIKGGLFDVKSNYSTPHSWHRSGTSVDINKDSNGDCKKNKLLLISVYIAMGRGDQAVLANRQLPSYGHFLCETANGRNRIHIDL